MDAWTVRDDLSFKRCTQFVSRLSAFLEFTSWLADAFVLEFFTENHWNRLPQAWQHFFNSVDFQFLAAWLSPGNIAGYRPTEICPLSLLAFRATAQLLWLPRRPQQVQIQTRLLELLTDDRSEIQNGNDEICKYKKQTPSLSQDTNFRRRIKRKKQHEISHLAQVISCVTSNRDIHCMVDVGSGQGHLSRLMAVDFNLKVISIDAEMSHINGAKSLDSKLQQRIQRRGPDGSAAQNFQMPTHFIHRLKSDSPVKEFVKILDCHKTPDQGDFPTVALVGLHTCGNFAGTLLSIFADCAKAEVLVVVPCCYMKETLRNGQQQQNSQFPLSEAVASLTSVPLSYEAKELACHAIESYRGKLLENAESLRIHCYRAVLEYIITRHYPDKKRLGLRSIKHAHKMRFEEYANLATCNLNLDIPKGDFTSSETQKYLSEWKRVVTFYSLRMMLAPVIETMLLLDRLLYLYERGCQGCILPVFNPDISPRNHSLIAVKPRKFMLCKTEEIS